MTSTYDIYRHGGVDAFSSVWSQKTRNAAVSFQSRRYVENNDCFYRMERSFPIKKPQQPSSALLPPDSCLPRPIDLLSPQSRLHRWIRKEKVTPPTLLNVFQTEWDPGFTDYLKKACETNVDEKCSAVLVEKPKSWTITAVDNYTIELIVAEGARNGPEAASVKIESLLEEVPLCLRNEYCNMLIQRARALIKKRQLLPLCAFCRNNGEENFIFLSHVLKDEIGRVMCPILRAYTCPCCGQNGDNAHTIKYCPLIKNEKEWQHIPKYKPACLYQW